MLPALVNISRRPIADYTCNTAYFCAEREVTSPRCRINASPLLHDDDISGIGHFDGGSAEMFSGSGSAIISAELHGYHTAGDSALRRILVNARHNSTEAELVHRIGDSARIQPI
jgi:hypothetical protein